MRWEPVSVVGRTRPGKRWGHSMCALNDGKLIYLFGGYGKNDSQTNDVHVFDREKNSWSKPAIKGSLPVSRDRHTCNVLGSKMFMFGGTDGTGPLADLHVLDTATDTWTQPRTRGEAPPPREGHAAAISGGILYVFGGCGKAVGDNELYFNDLHALNLKTFEWKKTFTSGASPSPRDSHSLTAWGNRLIVFGGEDTFNTYLSDVRILDLDAMRWEKLETCGISPSPRAGHAACCVGSKFVVFGGFADRRRLFDDVYVLDILTGVWNKVTPTGAGPSRRFSLAGDMVDAKRGILVYYGGCNENLEALSEMHYLHTGYSNRSVQQPLQLKGSVSLRMDLRRRRAARPQRSHTSNEESSEQEIDELSPCIKKPRPPSPVQELSPSNKPDRPASSLPVPHEEEIPPPYDMKPAAEKLFEARLTDIFSYGYSLETKIEGKQFRGVLFTYNAEFIDGVASYLRKAEPEHEQTVARAPETESYYPRMPQAQPLVMPEEYRQLLGSSTNPLLNNLAVLPP